jgi:hypothetical protein
MGFSENLQSIARTASQDRHFAAVVADQARFLTGLPVGARRRERADAAACGCSGLRTLPEIGVSLRYFRTTPERGGGTILPETTGYHRPAWYTKRRGVRVRERCFEWPNGKLKSRCHRGGQGGESPREQTRRYSTRAWCSEPAPDTGHEPILSAPKRAADFLVGDQGDGTSAPMGVCNPRPGETTAACSWALARFMRIRAIKYREAGVRPQRRRCNKGNGWFANNCLNRPEAPLLHTIRYTRKFSKSGFLRSVRIW